MRTAHLRFDIPLLADRLVGVTDWLAQQPETRTLRIGYFGASTGAAAALLAAVERPDLVAAIVSRGGRPDLARPALARVRTPTLLVVGARDLLVIELHREAFASCTPKRTSSSSRTRRTCSRSPARSTRSPGWHVTGSRVTWRPRRRRDADVIGAV
jgi:dienelactone hydrolase